MGLIKQACHVYFFLVDIRIIKLLQINNIRFPMRLIPLEIIKFFTAARYIARDLSSGGGGTISSFATRKKMPYN